MEGGRLLGSDRSDGMHIRLMRMSFDASGHCFDSHLLLHDKATWAMHQDTVHLLGAGQGHHVHD